MEEEVGPLGKTFWGRLLCGVGIFTAVVGAYYVSLALETVGIALGVAGYGLGVRRLGLATVVISSVALLVGILFGQDVMTGGLHDEMVNGFEDYYPPGRSDGY